MAQQGRIVCVAEYLFYDMPSSQRRGAPNGKVSWQVTGVRHDPYIVANPIRVEVDKGPGEIVESGEYIFPDYEQYAQ